MVRSGRMVDFRTGLGSADFIGGKKVKEPEQVQRRILPSVNLLKSLTRKNLNLLINILQTELISCNSQGRNPAQLLLYYTFHA